MCATAGLVTARVAQVVRIAFAVGAWYSLPIDEVACLLAVEFQESVLATVALLAS